MCFPLLPPSLPLLLPLFQLWLRNTGVRGHEGLDDGERERGGFIWETVTFLCALGQNTPPLLFYSPPITFPLLQRSASCSFPSGDPSPCLMALGQRQWPWLWLWNKVAQTCHGTTALTLAFPQTSNAAALTNKSQISAFPLTRKGHVFVSVTFFCCFPTKAEQRVKVGSLPLLLLLLFPDIYHNAGLDDWLILDLGL